MKTKKNHATGWLLAGIHFVVLGGGWQPTIAGNATNQALGPLKFEQPIPRGNPVFEGTAGNRHPVFIPSADPIPPATKAENTASSLLLKEYKPEGNRYRCHLLTQTKGRAEKEGWLTVKGGCYFTVETEFLWDERIVKNDGVEIQEERTFSKSRMGIELMVEQFGLTDGASYTLQAIGGSIAVAAASTGQVIPATGGKLLLKAGMLANANVLPKILKYIPYLGSLAEQEMAEIIRRDPNQQVLQFMEKALGKIKDQTIILTWRKGRLVDVRYSSGLPISEEDRKLAAMAGTYADLNILPGTEKKVGDVWSVSAYTAAQFFNLGDADSEPDVTGNVALTRNNDLVPGVTAALVGAGRGSYTGVNKNFDFTIESMDVNVHIQGANRFVSKVKSDGRFSYGTISDPDSPLKGVVFKAMPSVSGQYTCEDLGQNGR